jgi:hypothetical protein
MNEKELEIGLELDGEALEQLSGLDEVSYSEVGLWGGRKNHLSVYRDQPARWDIEFGRRSAWDLPLRCVPHPHPECRFRSISVSVDLRVNRNGTEQADVRVEDFSPRSVLGAEPVRLQAKRAGDLKFTFTQLDMNVGLSAEESREVHIHYPVVRGSLQDEGLVIWTFEPLAESVPLHADQSLRVLFSAPSARVGELAVRLRIHAKVQLPGVLGLFPVVGHRTVDLDEWHEIA